MGNYLKNKKLKSLKLLEERVKELRLEGYRSLDLNLYITDHLAELKYWYLQGRDEGVEELANNILNKDSSLQREQAIKIAETFYIPREEFEADLDELLNDTFHKLVNHIPLYEEDIDEEHEIIEVEYIKRKCEEVFSEYPVHYCYLFGSYAKGKATETSDVDLLVASDVKGLKFFGMVEKIRNAVHKRVDVLDLGQLKDNLELTNEILKDGIRIYG